MKSLLVNSFPPAALPFPGGMILDHFLSFGVDDVGGVDFVDDADNTQKMVGVANFDGVGDADNAQNMDGVSNVDGVNAADGVDDTDNIQKMVAWLTLMT